MVAEGADFAATLADAQRLGYAEADPTADIEGIDACRKACILADLLFGRHTDPEKVFAQGITKITAGDVAAADQAGFVIKLIGQARKMPDGKVLCLVTPALIGKAHPLAAVNDVFNAVMVHGNGVGEVMFYGRGAGDLPTASAVMGDVIDAVQHREKRRDLGWSQGAELVRASALPMKWYLRGDFSLEDARTVCGQAEELDQGAVITGAMAEEEAKAAAEKLGAVSMLRVL